MLRGPRCWNGCLSHALACDNCLHGCGRRADLEQLGTRSCPNDDGAHAAFEEQLRKTRHLTRRPPADIDQRAELRPIADRDGRFDFDRRHAGAMQRAPELLVDDRAAADGVVIDMQLPWTHSNGERLFAFERRERAMAGLDRIGAQSAAGRVRVQLAGGPRKRLQEVDGRIRHWRYRIGLIFPLEPASTTMVARPAPRIYARTAGFLYLIVIVTGANCGDRP